MPKDAYILKETYYNEYWEETTREIQRGSMVEQGERLFEGYKQKVGPKTIRLSLVDKEGEVIGENDWQR